MYVYGHIIIIRNCGSDLSVGIDMVKIIAYRKKLKVLQLPIKSTNWQIYIV